MSQRIAFGSSMLRFLIISALLPVSLFAYDGSETWLYYTEVGDAILKSKYQSVCKKSGSFQSGV